MIKNKKNLEAFMETLDMAGIDECPKAKGALLELVTTKIKPLIKGYKKTFVMMVIEDKWTRSAQLDEAIKWLEAKVKTHGGDAYVIDQKELDEATGVGVVVTEQMIEEAIDKLMKDNAAAIDE